MPTSQNSTQQLLLNLPEKKYFTIGEVSQLCELKPHVLRYWEQVFTQLEPSKRQGRRYYQRKDVELVLEIKSLLYEQGFTISGAKTQLSKKNSEQNPLEAEGCVQKLLQMRQELKQFQSYLLERY
ncbi:MerR family transcriptional regulator [Galenea microaerophila]